MCDFNGWGFFFLQASQTYPLLRVHVHISSATSYAKEGIIKNYSWYFVVNKYRFKKNSYNYRLTVVNYKKKLKYVFYFWKNQLTLWGANKCKLMPVINRLMMSWTNRSCSWLFHAKFVIITLNLKQKKTHWRHILFLFVLC